MADLRIVDAPEIPTENITGEEKLPTGGNGNYSISLDSLADYTKTKKDLADNISVDGKVNGVRQELNTHIEDLLNPHQVTKVQIGLGNVDNTADADKPVSNSTQATIISAVTPKADKTYVDNQLALKANKSDVYTKAETYTKQESNDLVNSSISTALTPVNASLDLAKRGVVNRYDSSLTYNSGERVVLTNGDIVKSTIDGNTNDPNVASADWLNIGNTSEVESIAELIAIQNPKDGDHTFVKDQQGGDFIFKSALANQNDGVVVFNGWGRVFPSLNVSPLWAGVKGDGITNDTVAIQKTIEFCLNTKLQLVSTKQKYLVSQTLLIPRNFDSTFKAPKKVKLDFGNSEFILGADLPLFESGYYDGGVLKSSYGQPVESQNSFEIELFNFTATTQDGGYPESYLIRIQDWHQGCVLRDISTNVFKNFLQSRQNFYMDFLRLNASYSGGGKAGTRFQFVGDHNLCTIRKLTGVNSSVGYHFTGGMVTALTFHENSLEGMTIGAQFSGSVYDIDFSGCYIEAIEDLAVKFETYVFGCSFRNNYINFVDHPDMHFMEYAPVPSLNITIASDNNFQGMSDDSKIIKNKEDVYGVGVVIEKPNKTSSDISNLLVDNTIIGKHIDVKQKLYYEGFLANVNNVYAVGNYSGKYTNDFSDAHGFKWINQSSGNLQLQTAILNSQTQRIYVNIAVVHGGSTSIIAGEFIGGFSVSKFFEFKDTGYILSTALALSVVAGKVEITGTFAGGNITQVVGEVRLI